ncbi:DNA polymerase epsilon catalytic subunit A [Caerostris extrusa]|uniref:DNA polymerase epsilon catalytic subunit n=1 Tax=Caerostris extrusa TaxID=172846 RepID=A0AAV4SDI0_CAEEX|nr:DNA polymerase epsilon catalytic subunit A [Caerostris extrusa]
MRRGACWYSMEMAGIVCHTGAGIITKAREIVEQIGRPLELDTDGIWCILPSSFPENFTIKTSNPKKPKLHISYPGAMLNVIVQDHNTNDQYHELVDKENRVYEIRKENSIFFEVDGPYLAMKTVACLVKLAEYEGQKSTSISTAKRLAEFLGDQMVKDAGLSCRFIISKNLKALLKWLKSPGLTDFDIRLILDWEYYIERFSSTVQKIITIPAALQQVPNPVPRVAHPDWLHKRLLEKNDSLKQKKITEIFFHKEKTYDEGTCSVDIPDIEDQFLPSTSSAGLPVCTKRKATSSAKNSRLNKKQRVNLTEAELAMTWQEYLIQQRKAKSIGQGSNLPPISKTSTGGNKTFTGIGQFLRKAKRTVLDSPWQIIQIAETGKSGIYKLWVLIENDLHSIKLNIPRIFYVNQRIPKQGESPLWKKVNRILPRSHQVHNLYEYAIEEEVYQQHSNDILAELSLPHVEGVYETQVSLCFGL